MKEKLSEIASLYGIGRAEYHPETTSTNDRARNYGYSHGDIILAESQTRGRGQRGNTWESSPGENLTFSIVLEPDFLPAASQFLLSETVSLAIADTLALFGIMSQIKWTNDIYVGDRKLAGILIENDLRGHALSRSIVGIGLNVNQQVFSASIPNPVSMRTAAGKSFERAQVLSALYSSIMKRYRLLQQGCTGILERDYHLKLYRLGENHRYRLPDGTVTEGIIREVLESGDLMVEHPGGKVKGYLFKEIEFII